MSTFFSRPAYLPPMPARVPLSDAQISGRTGASVFAVVPDETNELTPDSLTRLHAEYGDAFAFSHRSSLHYFFCRPSAVSDVLIHKEASFCQGDSAAAFSAVVGWGLLGDHGDSHRMQKQSLSPALRGSALDSYLAKTRGVAETLTAGSRGKGPTSLVDWCRTFGQATAEKALFPSGGTEPDYSYQRSIFALNESVQMGNMTAVGTRETASHFRGFVAHRDLVLDYVSTIVQAWRSRDTDEVSLMDFMIESPDGEPISTSSVTAQVAVFLQAATETTASLIAWSLMWLQREPQYWDSFREQPPHTSAIEMVRDPKPKAFIDEVLRLNPPAWFTSRVALEPVAIADVMIPRGARVVIAPWISHRLPEYFSEPGEFRPERWLSPDSAQIPRGAFLPFGLGSRICVGERFARLTATVLFSELARHTRLPRVEVGDGAVGTWGLVSNPRQSVIVDFP